MDSDRPDEVPFWGDNILLGGPHLASRWDSYVPSPGYNHPEATKLSSSAIHMPYYHGLPQTPPGLAYRGHLRPFQDSDGPNSISPASTVNNMATDSENQQEDEPAINFPNDGNNVEGILADGSGPKILNMPLHGLVLDTRSADVRHIGQWYFVR
jgi:hypothetical protein